MKYLGSKTIKTDRLILKAQTMEEQKRLWEILMLPEVNQYFLIVPPKWKEKLKNWSIQEKFYQEEMKSANDDNIFKWSIFLKDTGKCIGRITCHEASDEDLSIQNPNIRGVGWIIDPDYQRKGYGKEAAKAMLDYMFLECEIEEIKTGAAILNPASWKLMESLGFERQSSTKQIQYTFLEELVETYQYVMTRERYLLLREDYV